MDLSQSGGDDANVAVIDTHQLGVNQRRNRSRRYDYLFKVLVIGDVGVGKTSLTLTVCYEEPPLNYVSTVGVDFRMKTLDVWGFRVKLHLWDTAGQERFRALTRAYYRGAHGIVLVYDVTNGDSFDHIPTWISEVERQIYGSANMVLVGNKRDLLAEKVVDYEMGRQCGIRFRIPFMETTMLSENTVIEAFEVLVHNMVSRQLIQRAREQPCLQRQEDREDEEWCWCM